MRVIKPPENPIILPTERSIFLAGSIEMGSAENWQKKVEELLVYTDLVVLNPRRDDWDSSWKQRADNPVFRGQVNWELDGLEYAHYILMYFDKETKSPITLLELGHISYKDNVIVVCPEGFYRKGNVDIFCQREGIIQYDSLEEAVDYIIQNNKR